jgi:hypothetical protein
MQIARYFLVSPASKQARLFLACLLGVCIFSTGCSLSPLSKHAAAFSTATGLVIDNSESAYRTAMQLRQDEQAAAAVYDYDKNPSWSPYQDFKPLLTPEQLDARIKVLDGLKAYAATLVDVTSGKPSKDLQDNAAGVGTNLQSLSQSVATAFSTSIPNLPVMSTATANALSTAVLGLSEYLIGRKVSQSLPKVTQDMNPNIQAICELLNQDTIDMRRQADVDYQTLIENDNQFIRHQTLDAVEHRDAVGKLLTLAAQQKANDALLAKLQTALHTLAMTHQALAAAAQGNDPESIKQKIAELAAAGKDLSNYYKSLQGSSN